MIKKEIYGFPIELITLSICAFAIGSSEFVIMGLLPDIANSLYISLPKAGWLISGYALGVAFGSPIIVLITGKLNRKNILQILMMIFIIGNILCSISDNYILLMVARIITSFCHGAFFGIGSLVAAEMVSENKKASAVAIMFTGLTLANILGVPFGTLVGNYFGWHTTFLFVVIIGVFALVLLSKFLSKQELHSTQMKIGQEFKIFANYKVCLSLSTTILGFSGVFMVLTYITPLLSYVARFNINAVATSLFIFGIGLTIGNILGGYLVDKFMDKALRWILICLTLVMLVLHFSLHYSTIVINFMIFLWGLTAFATVPALQINVMEKTINSPNIVATLNIGAFNLGNAIGAAIGGIIIGLSFPLTFLPIMAAVMTLFGIIVHEFNK